MSPLPTIPHPRAARSRLGVATRHWPRWLRRIGIVRRYVDDCCRRDAPRYSAWTAKLCNAIEEADSNEKAALGPALGAPVPGSHNGVVVL